MTEKYVLDHTDAPLPKSSLLKIPTQPTAIEMIQCILDAGAILIFEEGVAALSTNRIADMAGVSTGSLYQYFANKEAILAGIIERSTLHIIAKGQFYLEGAIHEPIDVFLKNGINGLLDFLDPHIQVLQRVMKEVPLLAESSVIVTLELAVISLFNQYFVMNAHRYRVKKGSLSLYMAANTLIFMYMKWMVQPPSWLTREQFVECLVDMLASVVEPC